MTDRIKGACVFCGGHIAYGSENAGRVIQCPHCKEHITLGGDAPITGAVNTARRTRKWLVIAAAFCAVIILCATGIAFGLKARSEGASKDGSNRQELEKKRLIAEVEKAAAEAELAK